MKSLSRVQLFATPWTIARQAPPSIGFSRHEYWGELPFPSPEDLPDSGIQPQSPAMQADALSSEPQGSCYTAKFWGNLLHCMDNTQSILRFLRHSNSEINGILAPDFNFFPP